MLSDIFWTVLWFLNGGNVGFEVLFLVFTLSGDFVGYGYDVFGRSCGEEFCETWDGFHMFEGVKACVTIQFI